MAVDKEQLRAAAAGAQLRVSDRLSDAWWSLLIRGLLAVALGLAALFWPKATLALLIRLVGLYALFDGIIGLLGAFRSRELGAYLAPGLISIAIGLVLLFWPDVTGRLLLIIIGMGVFLQGVMLFLAGRQTEATDPERGLAMTVGVVAAIVGLVLFLWPGTGAVTISWAIGIAALIIGALVIYLALRVRRVEKGVERLGGGVG